MHSDVLPVLIVEDDEPTQNLLQAMLRRWGYTSEIAANGREAIASLERSEFSTIVLDMMMPSVGGREVIEYVTARSKPTPIIICSAAGPATFQDLDPAIVKAIVRKPFDIDEVINAIDRVTRPRVP
jgi:two-component system OmpR family response regulator